MSDTVTMYDSENVDAIPASAKWVAGYIDQPGATWGALIKRFPKARKISITRTPTDTADVLDVERGAATALDVPGWLNRMRRAGRRPIVYTSRAYVDQVLGACGSAEVQPPFLWVADWTGKPHLVDGSIATQYASPTVPYLSIRGDFDLSVVSPEFPETYQSNPTKGKPVIKIPSAQQIGSYLRQASAIVAEVIAIGNQAHLPPVVRGVLAAAGGLLLTVEHYLGDPSTGNPTPPA
jgi:hypothetical protein